MTILEKRPSISGGDANPVLEPDQFVYRVIHPVGDLNNDGFSDGFVYDEYGTSGIVLGSSSGYILQQIEVEIPTEAFSFGDSYLTIKGFTDLNGDGYRDFIIYERIYYEDQNSIAVFFGGDVLQEVTLSAFELTKLSIFANNNYANITFLDLDNDGAEEIVQVTGINTGFTFYADIYSYRWSDEENKFYTLQEQLLYEDIENLPVEITFVACDINGDGTEELITGAATTHVFEVDSETGLLAESYLQFSDIDAFPIGDINNDGRIDFLKQNRVGSDSLYLAYGPESLSEGLSDDVLVTKNLPNESSTWSIEIPYQGGYGNVIAGQGDDAIIMYDAYNDEESGRWFISDNGSGVDIQSEFALMKDVLLTDQVYETANAGDINGDGIEDFVLARRDADILEIFYGNNSINNSPDITIDLLQAEAEITPLNVTAGDFNGDGFSDLLVSASSGNRAYIYLGGSQISSIPDVTINPEDFVDSDYISAAYLSENIGDVNGDGIEDFMLSSALSQTEPGNYLNELYLFYGSASIPGTPSEVIDLAGILGTNEQIYIGYNSTTLGDINEDGYEDFAVTTDGLENENGTTGAVNIFFGNPDGEFDEVDLQVILPDSLSETDISYFGLNIASGGDVNGDDKNDIVILSSGAYDDADKTVAVVFGGADMDENIDHFTGINAEAVNAFDSDEGGQWSAYYTSGEIKILPDVNGDKNDDVLYIPVPPFGLPGMNPIIFSMENDYAAVLESPNSSAAFGGINYYYEHVSVGDFDNNGSLDVIMPLSADNNEAYRSSRVYMYSVTRETVSNEISKEIPLQFSLEQNYPNPFNPTSTITYNLPEAALVRLNVYNALGQKVATLVNKQKPAGIHTVQFNASELASGMYIYRIEAGHFIQTKKMMLIK